MKLAEENRYLLTANDALKAEIVRLKRKLEDYEQIRKEDADYIRGLWEDNQRVHAQLRLGPQSEKL